MKTSILSKFYLLQEYPEFLIGAMLEDYINSSNIHQFSKEITDGFHFQKELSAIISAHPAYIECEKLLPRTLHKNSGKILPLFFDHFVRSNWCTLTDVSFEIFENNLTCYFEYYENQIPYKHKQLLRCINKYKWNELLCTISGTHKIMTQLTKYFSFSTNMELSISNLVEHYGLYKSNFIELFTDISKRIITESEPSTMAG